MVDTSSLIVPFYLRPLTLRPIIDLTRMKHSVVVSRKVHSTSLACI